MELKYDIYTLNNAQGTGEKRQYVRIVQYEPMTEKQLQEKIQNCYITTRILRILFGLTPYMAQKWLNHFCEKGIMEKEGTQHAPIYFLK